MRKFRTLLGVGIAGACVLAGLPGVALAAPTAPYTVFTVDLGGHGSWPIEKSGVYDSSNATINASSAALNDFFGISASNLPGGTWVSFGIEPPVGQTWAEGQTYVGSRFKDDTHARLDMSSGGHGCNESSGSIAVKQVKRDPATQALTAFAASYAFSCENGPEPITGEVRWNSDVQYLATTPNPSPVDFGSREIAGAPGSRTVTVTSVGTAPIVFGAATIGGDAAPSFSVTGNACASKTILPGGSCTVTVASSPQRGGDQYAALRLADNSSHGHRTIPLKVVGFHGVSGQYFPLEPKRLMDTRSGLGAPKARIGAGRKVDLQVTGRGGVPAQGVGSVVLNVTVTGPTAGSFLTLYPAGQSRPTASSINFPKSWLGSNNVTVKVGTGGKVSVYNNSGSTDVVVDVVGLWASDNALQNWRASGNYQWYVPSRVFDTRSGGGQLPAGYYTQGWVNFGDQVNYRIRGVVLNITAVKPKRAGFLSAWSGAGDVPASSTVNYAAGKVVPNLAYVQTNPCYESWCPNGAPTFAIYTSQTTDIVVDLVGVIDDGFMPDGLRFKSLSPTRIADSRAGQGTVGALGAGAVRKITAPAKLVTDTTEVLSMNVTAVTPTSSTVITVWPADFDRLGKPSTSNLNPATGQTVSNAVLGVIGPKDAFNVHNLSGSTHLVADVVGTLYLYPGTASSPTAAAALDSSGDRLKVLGTGVRAPVRG